MKLNLKSLENKAVWLEKGYKLPEFDIEKVTRATHENPEWIHFGAGNIFRIFVGGLADTLIAKGEMDRGITCVETFDFDVVDQIYAPYDNLVLAVTLNADATTDKRVLGSLSEAIKAQSGVPEAWNRLKAVFADPSLQMVSFTITEKGYGKRTPIGEYRITNRGGKGVKTINITEKTGKLISIQAVTDDNDLMIINRSGLTIRTAVSQIRLAGRATQGVRIINLREGDAIASVMAVPAAGEEEEVQPAEGVETGGETPGAAPAEE